MELSYWKSRWNKGNIGFHMPEGYPGLKEHWPNLDISDESVVLVPLCGKSVDLIWLSEHVKKVVGVEVSKKAIHEFFAEQNVVPKTDTFADFTIYKSGNIELWCGDFFKFPLHKHNGFDLIYDKAALQALPKEMRLRYVKKVIELSTNATQILLHHFTYPQNEMTGPPFSINETEVNILFGKHFVISIVEENEIPADDFKKFKKRGLSSSIMERLLFLSAKQA